MQKANKPRSNSPTIEERPHANHLEKVHAGSSCQAISVNTIDA
ncbi:31165_t:CDS:2, partial [Gigaspora margarita]